MQRIPYVLLLLLTLIPSCSKKQNNPATAVQSKLDERSIIFARFILTEGWSQVPTGNLNGIVVIEKDGKLLFRTFKHNKMTWESEISVADSKRIKNAIQNTDLSQFDYETELRSAREKCNQHVLRDPPQTRLLFSSGGVNLEFEGEHIIYYLKYFSDKGCSGKFSKIIDMIDPIASALGYKLF